MAPRAQRGEWWHDCRRDCLAFGGLKRIDLGLSARGPLARRLWKARRCLRMRAAEARILAIESAMERGMKSGMESAKVGAPGPSQR